MVLKRLLLLLILFPLTVLAQTFGPTKSCDDLWQIAYHLRPNHTVMVQQYMLAILNKNPEAFYFGNVNGLKEGFFLKMPSLEESSMISKQAAVEKIKAQNNLWKTQEKNLVREEKQLTCDAHHLQNLLSRFQTAHQPENKIAVEELKKQLSILQESYQSLQSENEQLRTNEKDFSIQQGLLQQQADSLKIDAQNKDQYAESLKQSLNNLQDKLSQQQKEAVTLLLPHNTMKPKIEEWKYNHAIRIHLFLVSVVALSAAFIGLLILSLLIVHRKTKECKTVLESEGIVHPQDPENAGSHNYQYLSGEDVVASKLDLAHAYIHMDDIDKAKKLLSSVKKEGNEAQQKEANDLLESLSSQK